MWQRKRRRNKKKCNFNKKKRHRLMFNTLAKQINGKKTVNSMFKCATTCKRKKITKKIVNCLYMAMKQAKFEIFF